MTNWKERKMWAEEQSALMRNLGTMDAKFREVMWELGIQHWQGEDQDEKSLAYQQNYLVFLQWARIFSIPEKEVLTAVIPEMRGRLKKPKKPKKQEHLTVSINALTGQNAYQWLSEQFQERIFYHPAPIVKLPKKYQSVEAYANNMEKLRKASHRRRPYRGSEHFRAPVVDIFVQEFQQ